MFVVAWQSVQGGPRPHPNSIQGIRNACLATGPLRSLSPYFVLLQAGSIRAVQKVPAFFPQVS